MRSDQKKEWKHNTVEERKAAGSPITRIGVWKKWKHYGEAEGEDPARAKEITLKAFVYEKRRKKAGIAAARGRWFQVDWLRRADYEDGHTDG